MTAVYAFDVVDGMLECSRCRQVKSVSKYHKDSRNRTGYYSSCSDCVRLHTTEAQLFNRALKYTYNITYDQFLKVLAAQGGVCAICKSDEVIMTNGKIRRFAVDHDHSCCPGKKSCGKCVRGIVCDFCNKLLGFLEKVDSIDAYFSYLNSTFSWPSPEPNHPRKGTTFRRFPVRQTATDRQPNRGLSDDDVEFTCTICWYILPMKDAHRNGQGRTGWCIPCAKKKEKEYRKKYRSRISERKIDYTHFECVVCKLTKLVEEFYKDKTLRRGHQSTCKSCKALQQKSYRVTGSYLSDQ